jgi:hypothetical protein
MEDAEQGGRANSLCLRAAFVDFARRNAVLAAVGARTRYLGVLHVHLVRAAGLHSVDQLQSLRYDVYLLHWYESTNTDAAHPSLGDVMDQVLSLLALLVPQYEY